MPLFESEELERFDYKIDMLSKAEGIDVAIADLIRWQLAVDEMVEDGCPIRDLLDYLTDKIRRLMD